MKAEAILELQEREAHKLNVLHAAAAGIRRMLETARRDYGAEDWDADDIESQVLDLVTGEES